MTLYEQHIGRPMKPCEAVEEREYYINLSLTKESIKERNKLINKETPKQLTLFPSA